MDQNINSNKNKHHGIEMTNGESIVLEIKKHPVGALFILLTGFVISLSTFLVSIFIFSFLRSSSDDSLNNYAAFSIVIGIVIALIVMVISLINMYLYNQNKLILSTDKIAQIEYTTIIDRKVVQLSIDRLQDVSVTQTGVFSRMFKYGTIIIDTAGEQEDCIFTYAPNPYELSRAIMEQHEKSVTTKPVI